MSVPMKTTKILLFILCAPLAGCMRQTEINSGLITRDGDEQIAHRNSFQGKAVASVIERIHREHNSPPSDLFFVPEYLLDAIRTEKLVPASTISGAERSTPVDGRLVCRVSVIKTTIGKTDAEVVVNCYIGPEEAYIFRVKLKVEGTVSRVVSIELESSA
jgi:hypothetical protein